MPAVINIANMCSHVQNASQARLAITSVKNTKYNLKLALAMHRAGLFSAVYRAGTRPPTMEQMMTEPPEVVTSATVAKTRIWLGLKYWDGMPVLSKVHTVTKPKRIITADIRELARLTRGFSAKLKGGIMPGLGVGECLFVATSAGVLEAREAISRKVGGLLLCRAS